MKNKNCLLIWTGCALIIVGVVALSAVPLFYWWTDRIASAHMHELDVKNSDNGTTQLEQAEGKIAARHKDEKQKQEIKVSTVIGTLSIPSIDLEAPIIHGTEQKQLAEGVGHLVGSALPGRLGKSVLAAHNNTFFRNIGQLKRGDLVIVTTGTEEIFYEVNDRFIMHVDDVLPDTAYPSLALQTCYPKHILHPDQRLFVEADLVTNP